MTYPDEAFAFIPSWCHVLDDLMLAKPLFIEQLDVCATAQTDEELT